jgi:hypothetical protein
MTQTASKRFPFQLTSKRCAADFFNPLFFHP